MSNRERIERLAAEKAAAEEEKKKKKESRASSATTRRKKAAPARKSEKTVWKVFNDRYKEVAVFPYPEKAAAEKKAAALAAKSGTSHFVSAVKVPMGDD